MSGHKKRRETPSTGPRSMNVQKPISKSFSLTENGKFEDIPERSILKTPYSRLLSNFSKKVVNLTNVTRTWSRTMTEDYMNDNDDSTKDDILNPNNSKLTKVEYVPMQARFGSKLSPEAQFALFRGYEDILIGHFVNSYPNYSQYLKRTETPTFAKAKVNGHQPGLANINENFRVSMTSLHENETEAVSRPNSALPSPSAIMEPQEEKVHQTIAVNKQLRLTDRLEIAMDILDAVKEKQGMVVTSPRLRSRSIRPINNYIAWNHAWSREFKIKNLTTKK